MPCFLLPADSSPSMKTGGTPPAPRFNISMGAPSSLMSHTLPAASITKPLIFATSFAKAREKAPKLRTPFHSPWPACLRRHAPHSEFIFPASELRFEEGRDSQLPNLPTALTCRELRLSAALSEWLPEACRKDHFRSEERRV